MVLLVTYDYGIVGAGKTGRSALRYLIDQGYTCAVWTAASDNAGRQYLAQHFPHVPVLTHWGHAPWPVKQLVLSPGVDVRHPAIKASQKAGITLRNDVDLLAQAVNVPIVAITGTNGKTTVTSWLAHLCQHAGWSVRVGGNIGVPALSLLPEDPSTPVDFYILELSSFQLAHVPHLSPHVAVCLNTAPDHLDRYDNLADYYAAKAHIYEHALLPIINRDDPQGQQHIQQCQAAHQPYISFGLSEPDAFQVGIRCVAGMRWIAIADVPIMAVDLLPISGEIGCYNAMATVAMAQAMGMDIEAITAGLQSFKGLPHRREAFACIEQVQYVDDSKSTNVAATLAALAHIKQPVIVLLGGQGKGEDYQALQALCQNPNIRQIITFGEQANTLAAALNQPNKVGVIQDLEQATQAAIACAKPGEAVWLSPACASQDAFKDYVQRGEQFKAWVKTYATSD